VASADARFRLPWALMISSCVCAASIFPAASRATSMTVRLERTLVLVGYAYTLWRTGVPWDEAKEAAFAKFQPLTNEEIKRARETG